MIGIAVAVVRLPIVDLGGCVTGFGACREGLRAKETTIATGRREEEEHKTCTLVRNCDRAMSMQLVRLQLTD